MRRLVVALLVAALAFTVVGCGGGGDPEEPAAAPEAPADPAAAPAEPAQPEYMTDKSATEQHEPPVLFPSFTTTETPAVFTDKLDAGRPMLIFFYDTAQGTTDDVRTEIDAVMKDYRGLIDLITFNTGEKTTGDVPSESAKAAVVYANELGVNGTPYIIAVDRYGYITWRWKAYVDSGYIGREVERATE